MPDVQDAAALQKKLEGCRMRKADEALSRLDNVTTMVRAHATALRVMTRAITRPEDADTNPEILLY